MADPHSTTSAGRFEVRVTSDSHFGWVRTRLSVERTMMSWIRTATALIGFGFAIVQFFERLQQMPGARPALYPNASRDLGLALIAASWRCSSRFGSTCGAFVTFGAKRSPRLPD